MLQIKNSLDRTNGTEKNEFEVCIYVILCNMNGDMSTAGPAKLPDVILYTCEITDLFSGGASGFRGGKSNDLSRDDTCDDSDLTSEECEALFGEPRTLIVGRDVWTKIFEHCDALMIGRLISACKGLWMRFKDSPRVEKWRRYFRRDAVCLFDPALSSKVPEVLSDFVCTANTLPRRVERNINNATGEKQVKMKNRLDLTISTFMNEAELILSKAVQGSGLIEAAKCGEEGIVAMCLSRGIFAPWAMYSAARFGHQSIASALLHWLARKDPQQPPEILNLTVFGSMVRDWIAGGDMGAILISLEYLPVYGFAGLAAENGDFEALEFLLYFQKAKMDNHLKIYACAAKGGRIDVIEWLQKNVNNHYVNDIGRSAAAAGQIHVIEWVMNSRYQNFIIGDKVMRAAAATGCSLSLIFVMEFYWEFYRVNAESADQAAINGHLDFLRYAKWYGELDVGRCKKLAQRHGHFCVVEGLKW